MHGFTFNQLAFFAFPIVAAGVLTLLVRVVRQLRGPGPTPAQIDRAISGGNKAGGFSLAAMGSLFFVAGAIFFFFIAVRPVYRAVAARSWPHTTGTVISSRVKTSQGSDSDTYSIDIRYRYQIDGKSYECGRYDTATGSSSRRAAKERIVSQFPPGKHVDVYYNPTNPASALLSLAVPTDVYIFSAIPLLFLIIGGGMVFFGLRSRSSAGAAPLSSLANARQRMTAPHLGPVRDSRRKRTNNLIAISVFAAVWNGIVVSIWIAGGGSWCLAPFLLVGAVLIIGVMYAALAIFTPIVRIEFARMPVRPGDRLDVAYTLGGNFMAIQSLQFFVEGRETVTFQQGTNTRTETKVVWTLPLLDTTQKAAHERGNLQISFPPGAMPTFAARHNKFAWFLCCRGDIPRRPDIKDDFEIEVTSIGMPAWRTT